MLLEVDNLRRTFGGVHAVEDLSLRLAEGSIGCLLGPSGCGKTTALRCIAGLETVDAGEIRAGGKLLSRPGRLVPPEDRGIGMVFQDYALFPHLDVVRNVGFGLHRLDAGARRRRVTELLTLVGLDAYAQRFPHELSGGQQQRVALARALGPRPQLVLLDEPFSNLDVELRERLSQEVRAILNRLGTTALMVTHDQHEAFALADVVGVMRQGKLEQWSSPVDVYHRPTTRFVADFVGAGVFVSGQVVGPGAVRTEMGVVQGSSATGLVTGHRVDLLLRPEDVVFDAASLLTARVADRCFRGADDLYTLILPSGVRLLSLVRSHAQLSVGSTVGIRIDPRHVVAYPAHA